MYDSANPFLNGNYAPWREEGDAFDLEVEGELPRELNGALYRIGPNPHFSRSAATTGSTATGWSMPSSCATAAPPIAIAT